MKSVILLAVLTMSVGCSTTKYQVQEIETKNFEAKGKTHDGKIGVNDKNQLVIKNERSVEYELKVQTLVNYTLREKADGALFHLKACRKKLADPRLGGSGKISPITDIDSLRPIPEMREEMGLDEEGDLKIVSEEFLEERLKAERRYEKELRGIHDVAERHLEECESELDLVKYKMSSAPVTEPVPAPTVQQKSTTTPFTIITDHRG